MAEVLQQIEKILDKNITGDGTLIHKPVMVEEVINYLAVKPNGVYIDATVGCGGHAKAILEKVKTGLLIGIDCDIEAIKISEVQLSQYKNKKLIRGHYTTMAEIIKELGIKQVDGVLFDLGVSWHQLSDPSRGFSFQREGFLDMRFNRESELTAYEVINKYEFDDLVKIFKEYGEEETATKIAEEIVRRRKVYIIETTLQLAEIIEKVKKYRKIHPATKVFQALRIYVNDELKNIEEGLKVGYSLLNPRGRLVVISYHSLEDRIAKNFMRTSGIKILTKKPLKPKETEIKKNPSARSAKLRAGER